MHYRKVYDIYVIGSKKLGVQSRKEMGENKLEEEKSTMLE